MMKVARIILIGALLLSCGCSAKIHQNVQFNPSEPIRVAILPFYQVENGAVIPESFDPNLFIDNIPLLSSQLKESPASSVQSVVETEIKKTSLDLISQGYVNSQLGHHGFVINRKVMAENLLSADPKVLGEFLGADAILFGKITRWDRSYYGLQSRCVVGVELKLVSAHDGRVLFSADGEDSDSRGLTGIPTGFSAIVLEPIRGLDNEIIIKLSQRLVKKLLQPLTTQERPEYVNSSGPALFGAVQNAKGEVTARRPLIVAALGTPDAEGSFSLGNGGAKVPMFEVEPGHYVGRYVPVEGERSEVTEITVTLRDTFGRTAVKKLAAAIQISSEE